MPLRCPLCSRANPDQALYCCHDGAALGDGSRPRGPVAVGRQPFANPFVFPSGRFCRNFDELVLACEAHWDEARDLLHEGFLESFLGGLGRADLSWAARRAAGNPDADLALDELLAQLPGDVRKPARLAVEPMEVNLGRLARGADHGCDIRLLNAGMGLVRGSVSCAGPEWLALGEEGAAPEKVFQFRHDQALAVRVVGRRLRGGPRVQEGRLLVESNGGSAVVVVRVEPPPVVPFPDGVLAGADSPRRLAEMARATPREAAASFESGAVARWYEANGWTYPVLGPQASGVAALQQFYEALGLAAAPRLEIDRRAVYLEAAPGGRAEGAVVVHTSERRAVFAHAATAVSWLEVGPAVLAGRTARVPLCVSDVPDRPGELLHADVQVTANGGQRFTVEVTLAVLADALALETLRPARAPKPARRVWRGPSAPGDGPESRRPAGRPGVLAWVLAGGFLLAAMGALAAVLLVVLVTPGGGAPSTPPVAQAPDGRHPDKKPPDPVRPPPANPPPMATPPAPATDPDDLARLLRDGDAEERLAALHKLAALGPRAAPARRDILRAMKAGDPAFRREALAALGVVGPPTAADVDVLADLAGDASAPDVRQYAVDALAALGPDARPAAKALCGALTDRGPALRRKAAEALGGLGPPVRDVARGPLIEALRDADPDVSAAAAGALARLGPPPIADAPTLQLLTRDKSEAARRYGLDGFRQLGPAAADFAPYLEDALADEELPSLRRLAAEALLAVAPTARRTAEALTKATSDPDPGVRSAAVAALAKVGVENGALPGLTQALASDDAGVAQAAEDALKAARLDADQIGRLGEALRKGGKAQRLRVMNLLRPLGPDAAPAVPGLCAVLDDGRGEVRRQAFAALAAMGPAARQAAGSINALLDDQSFDVRLDAATTLAAVRGPDGDEAAPVLIDALKVLDPDDAGQAADRDRAAAALGRIGEPAIKPLADALDHDFNGGGSAMQRANEGARLAAVKALRSIGVRTYNLKLISTLSRLLHGDPSQPVRDAAKEAWAAVKKTSDGK